MSKPNCYECKFRGSVPGDSHSCCRHPSLPGSDDVFGGLMSLLSGEYNGPATEMGIVLNAYGVSKGWAIWPVNFDPTWLEACNAFESKVEVKS